MGGTDAPDRKFFRLPTSIPVQGVEVRSDDYEELGFDGRLLDISGSGVLLLTDFGLTSGDRACLRFSLGNESFAVVVEVQSVLRQREGGAFHLGSKLIELSRREQDRLVRAINAEQVKLLERGVLRPGLGAGSRQSGARHGLPM